MWDLLIIGSGPAGCAAAITACRHGLSVKMLEASAHPRRAPGETLHPGIESLFAKLGLAARIIRSGFHRHTGIHVAWDAPARFEPYGEDESGPWRGFQADRRSLAMLLEQTAIDAGAALCRPVRPASVIVRDGWVRGIATDDGREHVARLTVDATGRHAWLARALGLPPELRSPPLRVTFGWTDISQADTASEPKLSALPDGWHWQAPLGDGRAAWVTLRARHAGGGAVSPDIGVDVSWRIHRPIAGPGYVLAGDSAVLLDPASSHGVLRALMSGILCAEAAAATSAAGEAEAAAALSYARWMEHQFDHDCEGLRMMYRRHPSQSFASLFS